MVEALEMLFQEKVDAVVAIDSIHESVFLHDLGDLIRFIQLEFKTTEPDLMISLSKIDTPKLIMDLGSGRAHACTLCCMEWCIQNES